MDAPVHPRTTHPVDRVAAAVRWLCLLVFLASVATMLTLGSPAADTIVEGDRYFTRYRHLRTEITRERYDQNQALMWRNRASTHAAVAMFASLFTFAGVESLRHPRRRAGRFTP